jgi:IPT/TIG domain
MMFARASRTEFSVYRPPLACLAALIRRSVLAVLLLMPALSLGQAFVQESNNTVPDILGSVSVTYGAAETVGNLNVVVVGWVDTSSSVTSVVDDNTNTYVLAGTTSGNGVTQAIYYARSIVLPNNNTPTITVTFNQPAAFPDVRILEYSGFSATAPLDNWAGASGLSTSADSGAAVTNTSSLILGAGTTGVHFTAAGSGFTLRSITSPFGDIVEDSNGLVAAGSNNSTADLSGGTWVMQTAAFSPTGVTYTNSPVVTGIAPVTGSNIGGTPVTITGTDFQPGAVVLFGTAPGGISGLNCVESGGTTLTCLTPADSAGVKDITVVNVDGKLGSATAAYTTIDVRPTISAIAPASGPTNGSSITITGTNFQTGARVTIGGLPVGNLVVVDSTTITADTPALPVGPADVTITNPDTGTITSTGGFTSALGSGPINYIQRGGTTANLPSTTIPATMPDLQTAGDLNVVIIGWADATTTVSTVTDTEGNTYAAALPPTVSTGLSQVIYYAKNIAGDTTTPNQITVTFSQVPQNPDIRILEYRGLDTTAPLDVTAVAGAPGFGSLADSGACTTTTPVELIVAGFTVGTHITDPGTGFTIVDLTQPNGDSAQHQITAAAGSCESTAPLSSGSDWVAQSVAFKLTPDFSLSAAPGSRTVAASNSATYTVTATPLNGFNSAVDLTCSIVPVVTTPPTCSFNPTPVPNGSGTSTLTVSTSAGTQTGAYTITVTGTGGSQTHSADVTLNVSDAPDFTIAASAFSPAAVSAGGSGTSIITIAPLNGFNSAVALTCSITPVVTRPPFCSLNPTSVASGSGTSTLTVTTTAATTASLAPGTGSFYAMWLPIGGLALVGTGLTSRRRKLLGLILLGLMLTGLIFMAACGGTSSGGRGGHPGTPAGTYTVTVTGQAGSSVHAAPVTVVVQ